MSGRSKRGVTEPDPSGLATAVRGADGPRAGLGRGPAAEPPGPPEYLAYYGLSRTPFSASAVPERPWLGASHRRLLTRLAEAIQAGTGIVLLTGDVGSGKTSLASGLLEGLDGDRITAVRVAGSGPEIGDFYQALARSFGLPAALDAAETFTPTFAGLVDRAGREHRTVLLALDEAQQLGSPQLDAVRDLAAAGGGGRGLVVLLVGQSEFLATLLLERHAELAARITARFAVEPLTPDEVGEYIRHRLETAGGRRELFSADAIREIARLSRGTPAVINTLCDRALLTGHRRQAQTLRRHSIEDCWSSLGAPEPARDRPRADGPRARRANGRAHALARARPRAEGRRAGDYRLARRTTKVLVAAVAGLFLVMGGYSLYSGRARDGAHAPAPPPVTSAEPRVEPAAPAAAAIIGAPPDQGTPSPPVTAGAAPPPAENRPAAARPLGAPSASRAARGADPEGLARRQAAPAPGVTAMPRDPGATSKLDETLRTAPRPGTASPEGRGPGETRAAEAARDDAPDAGSVIDWLLTEYPRKNR